MSNTRNYREALINLNDATINEIIVDFKSLGILTEKNCKTLLNNQHNIPLLTKIHFELCDLVSENMMGDSDSTTDEESEENEPYHPISEQQQKQKSQAVFDQIIRTEKEAFDQLVRAQKKEEWIRNYLESKTRHVDKKTLKILNDLNNVTNKYYQHLVGINIWGITIKIGPRDKIEKVEALRAILNNKEISPEAKIENFRLKIVEYKRETDEDKGLAKPRNPRWDAFLDHVLSILLINPIRKAIYGPFFQYPEGKKMVENSFQIIENYKPFK